MIFLRNRVDFTFKTKKSPYIECGLGDNFYVLVYGDNTVLLNNQTRDICFPIPVHYPSFILSFMKKSCKLEEVFEFKNEIDMKKMMNFATNQNFADAKIINEFRNLK